MLLRPSESEEKYIYELELKARRERFVKELRATEEAEKHRLKELHWMHCPKCGQKLDQKHHGKVEVDVCPSCKGLWLDTNELETILSESPTKHSPFQVFLKILGAR